MFIPSRQISIFTLILASLLAGLSLLESSSMTHAQEPSSPSLVKLRQEQVSTLREALDLANKAFNSGTGAFGEVDRLNRLLVDAELNTASSSQERATILQDALAAAKKQEDAISEKETQGFLPHYTSLEAKAYRLSIEVKLAEEQSAK